MKFRLAFLAAPTTLVVLSLLAACGENDDPPANTGGAPTGGTGVLPGGAGGSAGSAGQKSTAGASFGGTSGTGGVNSGGSLSPGGGGSVSGGTAGAGTAGISGGGSKSTGGVSGGGTGGSSTGGSSPGGSGGGGGAMIPGPNFETVQYVIQNVSCFGGLCHDLPENPLNLRLNQMNPDLHTRLTTHMTRHCGQLVNTASPADSALVKLLKDSCGATPRMPSDGCVEDGDNKCVPPDFINAIQQWIAAGAPR